jgi:hypothetical protein
MAMLTTEGRIDLMNSGIDATEFNKEPVVGNNMFYYLYFVSLMIILKYLFENFMIAIFINAFYGSYDKTQIDDGEITNDIQKQWIEVNNYWSQKKLKYVPKVSDAALFQNTDKFLTTTYYQIFQYAFIISHCLLTCSIYRDMNYDHYKVIHACNTIYLLYWNVELLLNLL